MLPGFLLCLLGASPALASPAWLPPTNLSAPGRDATNARVAMDGAGEAVVVWERQSETETNHGVQVSTRAPGGGFSAPLELSKAASEPDVAITPSGEAVAIWRHFDLYSGNYVIQASTRPAGGGFSAPVEVAETANAALPQDLHLVMNAAGDVAVAWIQQEPGSGLNPNPTLVKASVRPAGGGFSSPVGISPLPLIAGQSAQNPRLAIDAAGDVRVVWEYDDGADRVIQSAARPAGGGFSLPEGLTADGEDAFDPNVEMDSEGAATVVWDRLKEGDHTVQASQAPLGGGFSEALDLSVPDPRSSGRPAIAIGAAGATIAAWTHFNGSNNVVQAATRSSSGTFSAPVDLSPPDHEALSPEVGMDAAAVVVWQGSDGASDIVDAATGSGGAFSTPVTLSTSGQSAIFPSVAIDSAGDATVAWWRSDGAHTIVQAAGYDASPPVLQGVSIPSLGTVGVPVSFSASPFDVWSIAATNFGFGDGAIAAGTSASHVYAAPGTYQVTVGSRDAAGTPVSASAPIEILPSDDFTIGKLARNRRRGTATVGVSVPGPGTLVLSGKEVRRVSKQVERAGTVKLSVAAHGRALARLSKGGEVRSLVSIAFTPVGGSPLVKKRTVTLIEKLSPSPPRNLPHA